MAQKNRSIDGYKNNFFSGPTTLEIGKIIEKIIKSKIFKYGLFHISGKKISKLNLLIKINNVYKNNTKIIPKKTRKLDRSLNSSKFRKMYNYKLKNWNILLKELKRFNEKFYKNKSIAITGGTGSFGSLYLKKILKLPIKELRILSRDEEKQNFLRYKYTEKKIKFILCDIRDYDNVKRHTENIDYIIHAAALKQVPSCEFFPDEAIKTNTLGTLNVAKASIENKIKKAILLSTDKAVYPINSMGMTKALAEKIFVAKSMDNHKTKLVNIRYGNVIASRGSIVQGS